MINIVIFGPPGSGKGTQCDFVVEREGLIHISTGQLLRQERAAQTELGKKAQAFMDAGDLVPDEVIIDMLETEIERHPQAKGFLFDGFPRTVAQATALDELLTKKSTKVDLVIDLSVPKEELLSRLLLRGRDSGRSDDNETTIQNRIDVYNSKTKPVQSYYQSQGKHYPVDGVGPQEEIANRIESILQNVLHPAV